MIEARGYSGPKKFSETKQTNPRNVPGHDGITANAVKRAFQLKGEFLVELFNQYPDKRAFPECWKTQTVMFISNPRQNDRIDLPSFRLISLLPVVEKALRRITTKQIYYTLEQRGFNQRQFRFSAGRMTVDAIQALLETVQDARRRGKYCMVILLDMPGAHVSSGSWSEKIARGTCWDSSRFFRRCSSRIARSSGKWKKVVPKGHARICTSY